MTVQARLVAGGVVMLLLVGCGSREYSREDNFPPRPRELTAFALMELERRDRELQATEAAEEADAMATNQAEESMYQAELKATLEQEREEAIRDCILAGNNGTLCELDPDDPYGVGRQ